VGISVLSNALNSSQNTLEYLNLRDNHFGDIDLDELIFALITKSNLRRVDLSGNGIGIRGCTSIAELLVNEEAKLDTLHLDENSVVMNLLSFWLILWSTIPHYVCLVFVETMILPLLAGQRC
jgi:Ran GTPase-activating protein (RanGAP) involved in mRNA processing and transport